LFVSTFPSASPSFGDDPLRPFRQQRTDALIEANRAATPPGAAEQRAVPRMSIAELNAMDMEQIRARFLNSRRDDRPAFVRVLDLIDAPRNVVANLIFRDAARKAAVAGDTGAFGLPRVTFSDALRELGVENRVVRGVVGFAGDFALDPLTYVGPAGWGLRAGSVAVRKGGQKALSAFAKRGVVSDDATRRLVESMAVRPEAVERLNQMRRTRGLSDLTPDQVRSIGAGRAQRRPAQVAQRILGRTTDGAASRALRLIGGESGRSGGLLERRLFEPLADDANPLVREQAEAARAWIERFGRGTGPSVRFGGGGSEVLHVPFTDATVQVPPFTPTARVARRNLRIARDRGTAASLLALSPDVAEAHRTLEQVRAIADARPDKEEAFVRQRESLESTFKALQDRADANAPIVADQLARLADEHTVELAQERIALEGMVNTLAEQLGRFRAPQVSGDARNASTVLAMGRMLDEARELARRYSALEGFYRQAVTTRTAVAGELAEDLRLQSETLDRLLRQQQFRTPGVGGAFLNVDGAGNVVMNADPAVQAAVFERIRPILDEIEQFRPDARTAQRGDQDLFGPLTPGRDVGQEFAAREAVGGEAAGRLAELRSQLFAETAPLREGPVRTTPDDFKSLLQQRSLERVNAKRRELFDLAERDPAGAEQLADSFRRAAAAARSYAAMIDGTLSTVASPAERDLLAVVHRALGTGDDAIAASAAMGMRGATDRLLATDRSGSMRWLDAMDRARRRLFNAKGGHLIREIARVQRMTTRGAWAAQVQEAGRWRQRIAQAAQAADVPVSMLDDIDALATVQLYRAGARLRGLDAPNYFEKMAVDGELVDGPLLQSVRQLVEKLGHKKAAEVIAKIDPIADDAARRLDEMGALEEALGVLGLRIPGYVPHVKTEATARSMRTKRGLSTFDTGRSTPARPGEAREPFQVPRSTYKYLFQDPATGRWHQFYEFDRAAVSEIGPERLALLDPDEQRRILETREAIETYERVRDMLPPEQAVPRPADLRELNRIAPDRFRALHDPTGEPFFEERLSLIMGGRAAQHQRAVGRAHLRAIMARYALPIPDHILNGAKGGEYTLPGGSKVSIVDRVPDGQGGHVNILRWRGQNYRTLGAQTLAENDNPVTAAMGDDLKRAVFPEVLAERIDQTARTWNDDEMGLMLRSLEWFTSQWKTLTLLSPSWFIFNVVGDLTLAASGGINPATMARYAGPAIKLRWSRNDPEALRSIRVQYAGQTIDGEQLWDLAASLGVTNDNLGMETAHQLYRTGLMPLPSQSHRVGPFADLKADFAYAADSYLQGLGKASRPLGAVAGTPRIVGDRLHRWLFGPNIQANQFAGDVMRLSAFLALLDEGNDAATAAERVLRSMFDYSDLSRVERRYGRTLIPFYTWARSNLGYQLQLLLERPAVAASVPKLKEAIEETIAGENRVPEHMRPNWMRSALAVQVGADPEDRFGVLLGTALPQAEVFRVLQGAVGIDGAMDMLHYFGSQVNPLLSIPFQLGQRREFFSGRTIGPDAFSGDVSAGEFLARQIRPVSELGLGITEGRVPEAFDRGVGEGVGRALIGGRVQDFTDERLASGRLRDFKEEEAQLRRTIARARREDGDGASQEARVRLLLLYRDMLRAGLGDEVPRWAREQLEALAAPQMAVTRNE
jgi:hypothetical protein